MTRALLDATVLIAAADEDDQGHEVGLEIVRGVDRGELPTGIVTNEALLETLNYVHERRGHAMAVDLLDRFVRGVHFELPYNPKKNFGVGRSIFRDSGRPNFGDSLQAAYMRSRDVEYVYSFDDDFDTVAEMTRLNRAVDPYE
jgi:predicted nucleic acid-binding protein